MRLNSVTLWAGIAVASSAIGLGLASCAPGLNGGQMSGAESSATAPSDGRCPNVVGEWQSWVSFLFGEGDITINGDGTMAHRSGVTGTWQCQGDKVLMSWWGESPKLMTLQGNKLVGADGVVHFTRTQAQVQTSAPPPSSTATASAPERREAAALQPGTPAQRTPAPSTVASIDATGFFPRAAVYGSDRDDLDANSGPNSDFAVCSNASGDRAIAACTRIIDNPGTDDVMRANALADRAEQHGVQARYDLAIADFNKAIQAIPKAAMWYNARGLTYGMTGDYDRAIGDFTQAIELLPDFAAAYYGRGQSYAGKGAYDLALRDFAQAITLDPDYTLAYQKRAAVHLAKRDYVHAIADYTAAIRLDPDYATAYHNRGTAYALHGDYNHALGDYSKAIELQPDAVDFRYSRATLVAMRGNSDQAIADLDVATGLAPQRAEFYLLRGNAWIAKSDYERARRDFDQAIALDPKNAANVGALAWSMKGQLEYVRGDPAAATQDYDEAVRLAPRLASLYVSRGITWDARGEPNRAIRDYTQALTLQPDAKAARLARGAAYFVLGEFALAAEDFAPLKQDPADLHGALWAYLAQARAHAASPGSMGKDELARAAARRKPEAWPSPIFQMFLGQRDIGSVDAAAGDPQQRCEAQFYTGEWHLLQGPGARTAAAQALTAATKSCGRISLEYQAAVAELKRLNQAAAVRP